MTSAIWRASFVEHIEQTGLTRLTIERIPSVPVVVRVGTSGSVRRRQSISSEIKRGDRQNFAYLLQNENVKQIIWPMIYKFWNLERFSKINYKFEHVRDDYFSVLRQWLNYLSLNVRYQERF